MVGFVARCCIVLLAAALVAGLPAAAEAKSPPDRLVVSGGGLAGAVEIEDAAALASFNPWTRGFIAWERGLAEGARESLARAYTVSFYLGSVGGGSPIYVVHYAPDAAGGPGLIYVPGPADEWYRLNIGTIITGDSDRWNPNGRWQYATAAWDGVMARALGGRVSAAMAAVTPVGPLLPATGLATRPAGVGSLSAVAFGGLVVVGLGGLLRFGFAGHGVRQRA